MKIIVDKNTGLYLRLDKNHNENEIALEMQIVQGLYQPRWNGEAWEEGATQEYIDSLKATTHEPSLEEKNREDIDYIAIMTGVDL